MLKPECINFDCVPQAVGAFKTDVLGDALFLSTIFEPETFETILCFHLIEHFYTKDAMALLKDCYDLLRPGGRLIIEAPDISKILNLWRLETFTTEQAWRHSQPSRLYRKSMAIPSMCLFTAIRGCTNGDGRRKHWPKRCETRDLSYRKFVTASAIISRSAI